MSSYIVLDNTIHDPGKYEQYMRAAPAPVAGHGGEHLARGGKFDAMVRSSKPDRK